MENFMRPSFMFANGTEDRLLTVIRPRTVLDLVAVRDIGAAAAEALTSPERFHRAEIELAGDRLTMTAIAAVLSDVLGVPLTAPDLSEEEAVAQGLDPLFATAHRFLNELDSPAHPEVARSWGLPTTSFREWAESTLR